MRTRTLWPAAGLLALGLGAGTFVGCPEEAEPPPMTLGFGDDFATADHEPYFPIGPSAEHALSGTVTCNDCHNDTNSFKEYTCLYCHARNQAGRDDLSRKHDGMGDRFALEDARCYACHPRGEKLGGGGGGEGEGEVMTRETHAPWFPVAEADTHGAVGCGTCHSDYGSDWSQTLCAECHLQNYAQLTNSAHDDSSIASIYEANDDTTGCRECHSATPAEDFLILPFADHNAPLGTVTRGFGTNHYAPEHCTVCHDVWLPEPQEWAIDFSQFTCTAACHGNNDPHGPECTPDNQDSGGQGC